MRKFPTELVWLLGTAVVMAIFFVLALHGIIVPLK